MDEKPVITLEPSTHRGIAVILVKFAGPPELIAKIKSYPNARWSQTKRCWYAPAHAFKLYHFLINSAHWPTSTTRA